MTVTTHGRAGYRRGCRCTECRAAHTEACRRYRETMVAKHGAIPSQANRRRITYPKTCERCLQSFAASTAKTRFCSMQCAKWTPPKSKALVHVPGCGFTPLPRRHPVRLLMAKPSPRRSWWVAFVSGPCNWCGETFTGGTTTGELRYCSNRCARRATKKRSRFRISDRDRLAIYERDGWTCQLCQGPVDRDLPVTDDWAASLDHVECQSWALIPDHSPANLRLAHRWCNAVRGDGSVYSDDFFRLPA